MGTNLIRFLAKTVVCCLFASIFPIIDVLAAVQEVVPISTNEHIKELVYNPDSLHRYQGFYNYQSSIVFEVDEVIDTISVGASDGWQFVNQANRLFLKPLKNNADTNGTIITNKRIYHFMFEALEAESMDDPRLAYEVRMRYPAKLFDVNFGVREGVNVVSQSVGEVSSISDIDSFDNINFGYRISGSDNIKPVKVFDNGRFTYMQFPKLSVDLPAVFAVESDGYESLVNLRMLGPEGEFVVLEQVSPRFTLRSGSDVVCVYNDKIPFERKRQKDSGFSLFD